jgi:hypothetical protein
LIAEQSDDNSLRTTTGEERSPGHEARL